MRRLTLTNTLEYYDVPQILTAADATGTRYLCTLYEQAADGYRTGRRKEIPRNANGGARDDVMSYV